MSNVTISRADISNLADICEIENSCFSTPWSEKSVNDFLLSPLSVCFVAIINSTVCGYIGLYSLPPTGDITNVAVIEQYRNQGIGKMLVSEMIAHCKKCDIRQINLEVRESNLAALNLYKKLGFEKIGLRKNYYSNPKEAAIIMQHLC